MVIVRIHDKGCVETIWITKYEWSERIGVKAVISWFCLLSFFIMLTGKTSVLIDTNKSDEDAPPPADDTNQTIDSSVMDEKSEDEESEADDSCKNKREKFKQGGVMKAVDRSKFGKFIIHYGEPNFFFFTFIVINFLKNEQEILFILEMKIVLQISNAT